MKRLLPVLFLFISSVFTAGARNLLTGDLVFQVGHSESGFSSAITDATAWNDSIPFDHVGIVEIDSVGNAFVIEASPKNGVSVVPFDDFIAEAPLIHGKPGIVVKRLNFDFPVAETILRAKSHIGEPYDWSYLPDNGKTYCSELVFDSFLDAEGEHIFSCAPMNFKNEDGTISPFWIELFNRLGEEIPQGVLGTNPTGLSNDYRLVEILRLF